MGDNEIAGLLAAWHFNETRIAEQKMLRPVIIERMREAGLSYRQIAARLGLSKSRVHQLRTGHG